MKNTVILQNTIHPEDEKKFEGVERSYMIGSDIAVVGFKDGSEYYYSNYKIIKKMNRKSYTSKLLLKKVTQLKN